MKDFADELINIIIENEIPKIDNIMRYITGKIQDDFVGLTYMLLDQYYMNYEPEYYIRTDILRRKQPRGKNGKFTYKTKTQAKRATDKSLRRAITAMSGGQPVIGVARGSFNDGYIAGVIFDESYFDDSIIRHTDAGISEWDIVNNFLFSNSDGIGNHPKMQRSPEANTELINYLNNYSNKFDKHYKDACKKFK